MKYIVFLIIPIVYGLNKKTKYMILYNQSISTGTPITEEGFWHDSIHFDTVIVQGEHIIRLFETEITELRKIKKTSMANQWFSIQNAVVRFSGDTPQDTLYTSADFGYWKIGGQLFEDKAHFFLKKFFNLKREQ